jgi:hypothetical protein
MIDRQAGPVNGNSNCPKPRKPPGEVAEALDGEGKLTVLRAAHAAPPRNGKPANQQPRPAVDEPCDASNITGVFAALGSANVRGQSRAMLNGDEGDDVTPENQPSADEFVGSAYQQRPDNNLRGVFVPRWVLDVTESGEERLVLAQLAYWFGSGVSAGTPRAKIHRDYYWVAKTYGDLGSETGLTERQVRFAVDKLRDAQLIATEVHGFGGRPRMTQFRIRADTIEQKLSMMPRRSHDFDESADELY